MTKQEEYQAILKYIQDKMMVLSTVSVVDIVDIATYASYEQYIQDTKKVKKNKPVVLEIVIQEFEEFWKLYPATSKFEYKGKIFMGERSLKANKQVCLKLYDEYAKSTGYAGGAGKAIRKALQVQLEHIKIESYKKGDNRMQYMSSLEVYLRQRKYESWIGEEFPVDSENRQQQNTMVSI